MAAPEQTQKTKSDELLEGQRKIERLLARARSLVATCGEPGDAHIAVARGLLDARSRDDEVTVAVVGLMKCGKDARTPSFSFATRICLSVIGCRQVIAAQRLVWHQPDAHGHPRFDRVCGTHRSRGERGGP